MGRLGFCSVCRLAFKVSSSGVVTRHGGKKRGSECLGSLLAPASTDAAPQAMPLSAPPINMYNNVFNFNALDAAHINKNNSNNINYLYQYLTNNKKLNTCKYIPKGARLLVRKKLIALLNAVVLDSENLEAWVNLFSFPISILHVTSETNKNNMQKSINFANIIKTRLEAYLGFESIPNKYKQSYDNCNMAASLAKSVKGKMEQGNMKAAVRLLADDNILAPFNASTLNLLIEKHPLGNVLVPLPPLVKDSLIIECKAVSAAICSFPAGSAGGLDGLRPQHLKDLLDGGLESSELLSALTKFINCLYTGNVNPEIKNLLFGGNVTALLKKNGDIRPITVGCTLRRLASKCANSYAIKKLENIFAPRQLGVGVRGGAEAAVHSARTYLSSLDSGKAFIKLDFKNAFNCINRQKMLTQIHESLGELYNYCCLNYQQPIMLNYQGSSIISSNGVQQGDPLGPLLFALTIQPLINKIKSEFVTSYLDDISLGDDLATISTDYVNIKQLASQYGLSLNESKCEFISSDPGNRPDCFKEFIGVKTSDAELLGAAILKGEAVTNVLSKKCEILRRIFKKINLISAHDALVILRYSLSAPRIIYILRCSPCSGHPMLMEIDAMLRAALSQVTNVNLSDDNWAQASLPVRSGGLGLRSVASLADPAFLASNFSCKEVSQAMLPSRLQNSPDFEFDEAIIKYITNFGLLPHPSFFKLQRTWDNPYVLKTYNDLLDKSDNKENRARLLALRAPYTGAWLQAWPLTSCGLRLSDSEIRVSVALRLGANICIRHKCKCGVMVEANGWHGLSCRQSMGRHPRHSLLNELIEKALTSVNIPCIREPIGLSSVDGLRPDGVTIIPWNRGKCLAWDVTVPDTLAPSHVPSTSIEAGAAALSAATNKNKKYVSLTPNYWICPIAIETLGVIDKESLIFLKKIGILLVEKKRNPLEFQFFMQKISCALQRGNHISIIGTSSTYKTDTHYF